VFGNDRDPVVKLPKISWDGDYRNKKQNNHTLINLEKSSQYCPTIDKAGL